MMLWPSANEGSEDGRAAAQGKERRAAFGCAHHPHARARECSFREDHHDSAFLQAFQSAAQGSNIGAGAADRHAACRRPDPQELRLEELLGDKKSESSPGAALNETAVGTAGVIDDDESGTVGGSL